jgi:hypothetical protein
MATEFIRYGTGSKGGAHFVTVVFREDGKEITRRLTGSTGDAMEFDNPTTAACVATHLTWAREAERKEVQNQFRRALGIVDL